MIRNIFRRFTAWGIRLWGDHETGAFARARFKTALLYFVFMLVVLSISGSILDHILRDVLAKHADGVTMSHDDIADRIQQARLILRYVNLTIFAIGAYVLLGVTLRPIRGMIERQKRFVSNISHELRTPLTVMKAETELALRAGDALTREQAIALLTKNLARTDHIARIVQFFLLMSDYNSPQAFPVNRIVDIDVCLRSVVKHVDEEARRKDIEVIVDVRTSTPTVTGNPIALEKMILNLIRNAVIYTVSGGSVKVSLREEQGRLILSVTDTGIGIPENDLPHVFDPFYRARNAPQGGTGVGLSIVKEVARIHGATLSVESAPGEGTTFTVLFAKKEAIPTKKT